MDQNFTRWLMSVTALVLGLLGLAASFLPHEILRGIGIAPAVPLVVGVQVLGALYLGFAILDWMARDNLIGGVYSRPVAVGNLLHFTAAGLALLKALAAGAGSMALWPLALVYTVLAVAFGVVLFRHPVRVPAATNGGGIHA